MVHAPQVSLKVVVIIHFILTVWASTALLPASYIYMSAFILAFGFWAIVNPESTDAILMFMVLNVISIVLDIILLCLVAPGAGGGTASFCLAMAILNLLFKPLSSFVLYRLYQERGGNYSDLNIPGLPDFGLGGVPGQNRYQGPGGYQNPNQSAPPGVIETPTPHSMFDQSPPQAPPPK